MPLASCWRPSSSWLAPLPVTASCARFEGDDDEQRHSRAGASDQDLGQDADALAALRDGLRRYFSALGPEEGIAFDSLLAEGGL